MKAVSLPLRGACWALLVATPVFSALAGSPEPFDRVTTTSLTASSAPYISSAWADYDLDGDLDVFVAAHGGVNQLFRNVEGGSFSPATSVLAPFTARAQGVAWGDYDNDGFADLFVCVTSGGNDRLFKNHGGTSFEAVADALPTLDGGDSLAAGWGDYDHDGWLDLYVVDLSGPNRLYHNRGQGRFERVLTGPLVEANQTSVGCAWADYDGDGDLDLFVANGGGQNNALYRNQGDGTFASVTGQAIVSDGGYSVTGDWGDYDNDGDLDLFVANRLGPNFLYRNEGGGVFVRVLDEPFVSDRGESNGCRWLDYDNDGWLDLYVANFEGGASFLYHNLRGQGFAKLTGLEVLNPGNATAVNAVDYDGDHHTDLFVTTWPGRNSLFRNAGGTNHWLAVRCMPTLSNRSGYGTRVQVLAQIDGASRWQTRLVGSGDGWGSSDPLQLFGLGAANAVQAVKVTWPNGMVQQLGALAADQEVAVVEGTINQRSVVPAGFAEVDDDGYSDTLSRALRLQEVYGAANFADSPLMLNGLAFRRDASVAPFANGVALVTIRLSTTPAAPDALSMDFSANYGTAPVTVFDGAAALSSPSAALPGKPAPFELHFPFTTPFAYDPRDGNLLVEVVVTTTAGVGSVDQSNETSDAAGRVFALDAGAPVAQFRDSGADVLFLDSTATQPALLVTPAGGWRDGGTIVVLGTWQANGEIHYTLDGTEPGMNSPRFQMPLVLDESTVLKAALFVNGVQVSETVVETYVNREQALALVPSVSVDGAHVTLRVDGWEGFEFEVQSTPSFAEWTSHWIEVVHDGQISFLDPLTDAPARFYRLILRP